MKITPLILFLAPALANPLLMANLDKREAPPADQITITSATASGNGCPQGSFSSSFSTDKTVVTFGFDSFQTCKLSLLCD
jgi:hypothetical protein